MIGRRRLSLASLTVLDLDPLEIVVCAESAGYDAVGLRLIPATPEEASYPTIGRTRLVRRLRRRLDDSPISVCDIEIVRLRPDTRVAADYEAMLETGAYLGASDVLVAGNDPDRSRLCDRLAEFAALAQSYGLTPNIEFMPWTDVPDLEAAVAVLRGAGHDNLGLLIDSIHFDRARVDPAELRGLPAHWFRYFQLCDADPVIPESVDEMIRQARADRRLPGEGGIDMLAPLRMLPDDLTVSVEAPVTDRGLSPFERARTARIATESVLRTLGD